MAQKFQQSCQNWFQRVQTTILMKKKNIFENWFFFRKLSKFFPDFGKKFSARLAELLSKRSDEQYDVQPTTSLKSSSNLLGFWPKLFLKFRILFLQKCENCFLRTDTNKFNQKNLFLRRSLQSFSESDRNIFWLSAKNPRRDCQNCYLRVQKQVEETDFFSFFFSFFCVF